MILYEEALERIAKAVEPKGTERVDLQAAYGRVLAERIATPTDLPPFDNSAMDGFAVKASDVESASKDQPVSLKCAGTIGAGDAGLVEVAPGVCVRIMTGAPVPPSADGVVPVEMTETEGDEIRFKAGLPPGRNVRPQGSEMKKGETLLEPGVRIGAAEWGLLATANASKALVYSRPSVSLLMTGNELIEPGEPDRPGAIRNSNGYSMRAAARGLGIEPEYLGVAGDSREEIEERIRGGCRSDVLITVGGVSAGDFDVVRDLLAGETLGFEEFFYKVRIRPGKPVRCGRIGNTLVFALPGNPVSCLVGFHLFAKPALRKMLGQSSWENPVWRVILGGSIRSPAPFLNFWRAKLKLDGKEGLATAVPFDQSSSGMLTTMLGADGFVPVPVETEGLRAGEIVDFLPIWNLD